MGNLRLFYIETDVLTPEVTQQIISLINRQAPAAAAALQPGAPAREISAGDSSSENRLADRAAALPTPARRSAPPGSAPGKKRHRYLTIEEKPELGAVTVSEAAELCGVAEASILTALSPSQQKHNRPTGGFHLRRAEPPGNRMECGRCGYRASARPEERDLPCPKCNAREWSEVRE